MTLLISNTESSTVDSWSIGEPPIKAEKLVVEFVHGIAASGDELELIRTHITNIRMSDAAVVSWSGEDARFIARNLFVYGFRIIS